MRHLVTDKPQCTLYAAAMALDVDIDYLVSELGHDGMGEIDGSLIGIHMQEIQTAAFRMGKALALIEVIPCSVVGGCVHPLHIVCDMTPRSRVEGLVAGRRAILIGVNGKGNLHAVAYDDNIILDPNGQTYGLDDFRMREAWIVLEMR